MSTVILHCLWGSRGGGKATQSPFHMDVVLGGSGLETGLILVMDQDRSRGVLCLEMIFLGVVFKY